MAHSSTTTKYSDNITTCPICAEDYTDPRILPCVHTFCLQCISHWGRDLQPGDTFDCPLCRSEVQVPAAGFAGFPKNVFIDSLIQVIRRSAGTKLCDVCVDDENKSDDGKLVTVYCAECEQSLCQQCENYHRMLKSTKAHELVEISDVKSVKLGRVQLLKLKESYCKKHCDIRMEGYCFDCSLPVCMMCMHESHQSHKTGSVKAVAEELGGRIKATFGGLAGTVDKCKKMQQQLDKVFQENKDDVDKTDREITRRADDLKQLVDQIRDSLVLELRTEKKCQDKKVEMLREELEGQMLMVESFRKYSEELLSKGTCCDIVRAASDLENRARELMLFNEQINAEKLQVDVKFSVNTVNITDIKQLFGRLYCAQQETVDEVEDFTATHPLDPTWTCPTLLTTLPGSDDHPVTGITELDHKLHVACSGSNTIEVYTGQQTFSRLSSIKVNGMDNPWDISACAINKTFYVADWGNQCVLRVRSNGNAAKWLEVKDLLRLSVTERGSVVLLVTIDVEFRSFKKTWFGRVLVYSVDGIGLTNIKLPNSITNPQCVIQTANKTFIVSHGDGVTELNRVCEVNSEGKIIATFGGSRGSGLGQLNSPAAIVLDSEERILVADCFNHRVVLLDRQLDKMLRVLLSWNNDLCPGRLFYANDNATEQLAVGFYEGQVEIYSLT